MKSTDPRGNLIQTWQWGDMGEVEIYVDPKKAPRWILNRGLLMSPCDVMGCKRFIERSEWYVRHPFLGVVCRDCSVGFGVVPSEAMERQTAR